MSKENLIEITKIKFPYIFLDNVKWEKEQAEAIFKWLSHHGIINSKISMSYNPDTKQINFVKKFSYQSSIIPVVGDDAQREGEKILSFGKMLDSLIRIDRARYNAYKAAKEKTGQLWRTIDKFRNSF